MKSELIPYSAANEPAHRIRFVRMPDNVFYVTLLDRSTFVSFVCQAGFFIRTAGIKPRSVLGTVYVNDAQLTALTCWKEGERYDDVVSPAEPVAI